MSSPWDDPDLQVGGDYVKFENVGDTVSGVVNVVRSFKWDDGKLSPQLLLTCDDGEERTVTAGQIRLKIALADQRPEAGDHVKITLTNVEARAGGKTLKHFDVVVTRAGAKAAAPADPWAVTPAPASAPASAPLVATPVGDPQAAAAALAALTPEQRQALGIS